MLKKVEYGVTHHLSLYLSYNVIDILVCVPQKVTSVGNKLNNNERFVSYLIHKEQKVKIAPSLE